jgi:hypothetical protein
MPVKQGGRLVELRPNVVKAFTEYREVNDPKAQFTTLINDILEYVMAKEEFLKAYHPHLQTIAIQESSMYIQNKEDRKVFEVSMVNDEVKCIQDGNDQCEHSRFAMAMTGFGKIVRFRKNLQDVMRVNKTSESQNEAGSDSESNFLVIPSYLVSASSGSFQLSRNPTHEYVEFLIHGSLV